MPVRLMIGHQAPLGPRMIEKMATDDPVGLLRESRDRHRAGRLGDRIAGWDNLISIYACALSIRDDPARWDELLLSDYFDLRKYKPKRSALLRLTILVGTDADNTGRSYQRGCHKARILQPLFDNDVLPSELYNNIRSGKGLAGLTKPRVAPQNEGGAGNEPEYPANERTAKNKPPASASDKKNASGLMVEMSESMLEKALTHQQIRRWMMEVENYDSDGDWQRFRAVSLNPITPKE